MNLNNSAEQKRLTFLNMALVMRGGQPVSANELILDAETLSGWVIGVDYAAEEAKDSTVSYFRKPVGFDLLKSFSNDHKIQNHQNAGQFKTIALVFQCDKEYRCLLVAFYSRSRIEYLDYGVFSSSFDIANSLKHIICPHSVLFCGSARFVELLERKRLKPVFFVSIGNRSCFKNQNRKLFKRAHDFAVFNMANAVLNGVFSAIHPDIANEIVSILDEVKVDDKGVKEIPNRPKSLNFVSRCVAECLTLLFTEVTIDMTFVD